MSSFVKMMRSETYESLSQYPYANHMLNVIAMRARRTPDLIKGLEVGEAIISSSSLRLTDSQYRHAKKQLSSWGLCSFRATNKFTCAKLLNSMVYDINIKAYDEQETGKQQDEQQADDDKQRMEELKNVIMEEYNTLCKNSSWPKLIKFSAPREKALTARIKDCEEFGVEFVNVMKSAHESDFLRDGSGTWKCSFDFIVKKENFLKIVEGKYSNGPTKKPKLTERAEDFDQNWGDTPEGDLFDAM